MRVGCKRVKEEAAAAVEKAAAATAAAAAAITEGLVVEKIVVVAVAAVAEEISVTSTSPRESPGKEKDRGGHAGKKREPAEPEDYIGKETMRYSTTMGMEEEARC